MSSELARAGGFERRYVMLSHFAARHFGVDRKVIEFVVPGARTLDDMSPQEKRSIGEHYACEVIGGRFDFKL